MTRTDCPDRQRPSLGTHARWSVATILVWATLACSPDLDWRQLQPKGWPLRVALPCRPTQIDRPLVLAGMGVQMEMLTCQADGLTFAVSRAKLGDPAAVAPSLAAMGQAALHNLDGHVLASTPTQVPGMTPQAGAISWHLAGKRADGQPVQMRLAVFAHGTWVYQAAVVGVNLAPARTQPMFDSLAVVL